MITLIPKRKILGSQELMNSLALEDTSGILPLDDTAVDGRTQEGITSNWAYDHAVATTGVHGITGTIVGTEDVDDTPVNGATTAPVSSNWAYDTAARLDDCGQAEPTRAIGTEYQNTSGKIRLCAVSFQGVGGTRYVILFIKSSSPANDVMGRHEVGSDEYQTITFVVPPNYYYKVDGTATKYEWHEWDLL